MCNSYWLHQTSANYLGTAFCIHHSKCWKCWDSYMHWHIAFPLLIVAVQHIYMLLGFKRLILSYFNLVRYKLEYTLQAWNIVTTNANKLECTKWKFAALSLSNFFSHIPYNYAVALELLQLQTVQVTRHHFDALFFIIIYVFPRSKFYLSMIDNSSLQVPSCNIRNFTQFSAGHKNWPSTRCCKFRIQWYR